MHLVIRETPRRVERPRRRQPAELLEAQLQQLGSGRSPSVHGLRHEKSAGPRKGVQEPTCAPGTLVWKVAKRHDGFISSISEYLKCYDRCFETSCHKVDFNQNSH